MYEKLSKQEPARHKEGDLVKGELVKTLSTFRDNSVDISGFVGLLNLVQLVRSDLRDLSGAVAILAGFLSSDFEKKKEIKRLRDKTRKDKLKKMARMECLFPTTTTTSSSLDDLNFIPMTINPNDLIC